MKIAFVTARAPYPPDAGGRIRTFHLLREITREHAVTLVTAADGEVERHALAGLSSAVPGLAARIAAVPPRNGFVSRAVRTLRSPFDPLPWTWAAYRHPEFVANLACALAESRFDVVHCDHVQVADAVASMPTPPRVLNLHNVESTIFRRLAETETNLVKRRLIAWQARKAARAEAAAFRRFDRCIAVSDVEREEIARIAPAVPLSVVPNGVDLVAFRPVEIAPTSPSVVFTGAMDWVPNADAVRFFARQVLPRLRASRPDVTFTVVGRDPPAALVRELAEPGITFTGTVDDVRPYVAAAAVVVVPLRIGGGTRLKILEAWAMAKPVVSTTVGAEGLPVRDRGNILIADREDDLAAAIAELLGDPGRAAALGRAGRKTVEETFSWHRLGAALIEAYAQTIAAAECGRPADGRRGPGV
ncbi:MAG: polysaccharide biosynthesis protein PslH [Candidatus Binatota bacterium]|nr:polysaccharide biosynthesis protein PslH [Candidatus Binatota bacterium]